MALRAKPSLLVMDEPTTGLDVTVEAAVLDVVRELRHRHDSAILFISHNLGTVAQICDRVGVMYAGELVEEGPVRAVFGSPRHPYTRGLLDCLPTLGRDKRSATLRSIPGQVGSPLARPQGCAFAARCAHVEPGRCTTVPIALGPAPGATGHRVQCVRVAELPDWPHPLGEPGDGIAPAARAAPLTLHGLSKVYHQGPATFGGAGRSLAALREVALTAERGRTLALVREIGCGKSTLARILSGFQVPSSGTGPLDRTDRGSLPSD